MGIQNSSDWNRVERIARAHEAGVEAVMASIGLPLVKITVEDRLRGAIVRAMTALGAGQNLVAYQELERAMEL